MTKSMNWRTGASRTVIAAMLTLGGLAAPAIAQAAPAAQDAAFTFNIPAGSLAQSLNRFTEITGLQTVYGSQLVAGASAPAVNGQMTADQALQQILAGSGLRAQRSGQTVVLERIPGGADPDDGSRVLNTVMVEGSQAAGGAPGGRGEGVARVGGERGAQDAEAEGYRAYVASVGSGAPTPIEDIPRSVSVITQEQIEKQDITDIGDALRRLPGVTISERGGNDSAIDSGAAVYARGFRISSVQLDGGAPQELNVIGNGSLDLAAFERVELVRGPNGAFVGANSPGGTLNLVRKRPGVDEMTDFTALIGSFDRYRLAFDYSTPSVRGTPIAFRGVASFEDQGFWYANANSVSTLLYGIADAPLGDRARFEVGARYSSIEKNGSYQGIPRYYDGPLFEFPDHHYNPYPAWTYNDVESSELFGRIFFDLGDSWNLELGSDFTVLDHQGVDIFNELYFVSSGLRVDPSNIRAFKRRSYDELMGIDVKITGRFNTFGLTHNLYLAADYNSVFSESESFLPVSGNSRVTRIFTVQEFIDGNWPEPTFSDSPQTQTWANSWNQGLIISDTISWRDKVDLTLSARRYSSSDNSQSVTYFDEYSIFTRGTYNATDSEPRWLPSYALAFKPTENLTIYGSYSEGVTPQDDYYTEDGSVLDPATYENQEFGIKYGTDRWLATLSYYDLVQANVATQVPGSIGQCQPAGAPCYFPSGDTIQSNGYDLEFTGTLFPGFSVLASYNHNENEIISSNLPQQLQTPVDSYKLQVDWVPSFLPRASLQAGLSFRDSFFVSGFAFLFDEQGNYTGFNEFSYTTPSYTVFDIGLEYALTEKLTAKFFVENLTDEDYLSTENGGNSSSIPGAPRTFMVSLRWRDLNQAGPTGGPIFDVPFGEPEDWYVALDVGAHRSEASLESFEPGGGGERVTWNFNQDDILSSTGRLGYRISASLRAELELAYRRSRIGTIAGDPAVVPSGVCSVAYALRGIEPDCSRATGEFDNASLAANLLYDFGPEDSRVRPFIGAGFGLSRTTVSFGGKLNGVDDPALPALRDLYEQFGITPLPVITGQELIVADDSSLTLAFQGIAGVSWRLNDRASIDATYRYYRTDGVQVRSSNNPAISPNLEGFEGDYSDQAFSIGFRWAFGAR